VRAICLMSTDLPLDPGLVAEQRPALVRAITSHPWLLAAVAASPIGWLVACYFLGTPQDTHPTGFIQYDQAYYMAEAREHWDGGFHLLYGSPASPDYDTPRVYFRPQTLLLGTLGKWTSAEPGWIYTAFGLFATVIFLRLAIALYERVIGVRSRAEYLVLPLFLWGGGITALCGVLLKLSIGGGLFAFDTGGWGANLGRGVIYGIEAYYHALFFAAVLALLRRWYGTTLILVAAVCASHPFTGTELASIVAGWVVLEGVNRRTAPPLWFSGSILLLLVAHVGYWLVLLPLLSPEHAAVASNWNLPWVLHWYNEIPEYGIVGIAALWRLRDRQRLVTAFADRSFRVLFAWFCVAFLLANHDLFISPRQPVHFTHGYIWVPLFLIGAPTVVELAERLLALSRRVGVAWLVSLGALMLLDNAAWFSAAGLDLLRDGQSAPFFPNAIYIGRSARDVLDRLNDETFADGLVVSNSQTLSYAAIVYTPLRAWYSQMWNTPYPEKRLAELDTLFDAGEDLPAWHCRKMIAVVERGKNPDASGKLLALGYSLTYANTEYDLLLRSPHPDCRG
jgi:hypothetical protein